MISSKTHLKEQNLQDESQDNIKGFSYKTNIYCTFKQRRHGQVNLPKRLKEPNGNVQDLIKEGKCYPI